MQSKLWRGVIIVGAVWFAAEAASCSDGLGGILISDEQEVEIGAGVDEQIRLEYRIADPNDPLTQWAVQLVQPLANGSVAFRDPARIGGYKVAVIVDDTLINAFAAPGGFVYMTTGLILNAGTCGEIAGVMSHKLAHVTERHGVDQIEGAIAVGTLTEIFLGEGLAQDAAQTIWAVLQSTAFSREAEAEADDVGLQIAYNAGYNPYGLVDFFETLLALSGGGSGVPEFLSSHPATQSRIDDVSARIESLYGDQVNPPPNPTQTYACVNTSQSFEQVRAHIQSGQVAVIPGTGTQPPAQ